MGKRPIYIPSNLIYSLNKSTWVKYRDVDIKILYKKIIMYIYGINDGDEKIRLKNFR